jgi:hypothetical protein
MIRSIATGAIRLAQAIATSVAEISGASAISLGVAAAIALAAGAAAYAFFSSIKANDMVAPGGGGDGYGKRTLLGPEGAIRLNDKDTVIAGTNLFGDDVKSEPGKATETMGKGELKAPEAKKSSGGGSTDMTQTNALLRELISAVSTTGTVTLDGAKVGEALKVGSYKTQ